MAIRKSYRFSLETCEEPLDSSEISKDSWEKVKDSFQESFTSWQDLKDSWEDSKDSSQESFHFFQEACGWRHPSSHGSETLAGEGATLVRARPAWRSLTAGAFQAPVAMRSRRIFLGSPIVFAVVCVERSKADEIGNATILNPDHPLRSGAHGGDPTPVLPGTGVPVCLPPHSAPGRCRGHYR